MKSLVNTIAVLGAAMGLCTAAYGQSQNTARPGTVNYVEGTVSLDGRTLNQRAVGNATMGPGNVLSTEQGKVEVLLTPGVFLRLDDHSAVTMISPDLMPTQVQLDHGRASVEVDELYPQNVLDVMDAGVKTQLVKTGYYEFDANQPEVQVFHGQAEVALGNGKWREVKSHHEYALAETAARMKPVNFAAGGQGDDLYSWSNLRSQYLAQANNQIAGEYAGEAGFYPGWYWDPYMMGYTFIGWNPYWSPFGWGFYPPWGWYGGVWRGGWYGARGYYGGGVRGGDGGFHGGNAGGLRSGVGVGGFHGGGGMGRGR